MMTATLVLWSRGLGPDLSVPNFEDRSLYVKSIYWKLDSPHCEVIRSYLNSSYEGAHVDIRMYFCPPCVQLLFILKWTAFWSINQSFVPMQLQAFSRPSTCTTPLQNRASQLCFEQQSQHEEHGEPCNRLSLK